ncbi:AraC family transcriptional regulator [Aequorivita sp. SDUM287046]|uniref:AraC family transcriptional regulator n=1 Tax=Aequorivita aurantiaca TaxID=3053356 RepID=A0ABT8DKW5_9FLAO|nr:AraC family transcriptional regulator [Aequorivita aurantiaca]MDN3725484.1 AraC family transcriptional regulator [Aequorivita aurantiaca]
MRTIELLPRLNHLLPAKDFFKSSQPKCNEPQPIRLNNFVFKHFKPSLTPVKCIQFFSTESFYLVYAMGDTVTFTINGNPKKIKPHESCVLHDPTGTGIWLDYENALSPNFIVIGIGKPQQFTAEHSCFYKFDRVFKQVATAQMGYFKGKPNPKISDKIIAITNLNLETEANELIFEGLLFNIYGLAMLQINEEHNNGYKKFGGFSCKEVEQLARVSQKITANPGSDYTISSLCRETGLGPNKLQQGFKKMHNRTIIDYIRTKRLEKAVELMKTTNLSISEIVYSVGLSSRSYFSKIFKHKYKCSPKQFQQLQRE